MSMVSNHTPEILDEINSQEEAPRPRVRKPRPKPERRIRLTVPLNDEGQNGIVNIAIGKDVAEYYLNRIPADYGQGFTVEKIGGTDDAYQVNIDGDSKTCSCKGHGRWNHRKHADGLAALQQAGKL